MMIHYTDAILTAIFGGGIAVAVYIFLQMNKIAVAIAKVETKVNIIFDSFPKSAEAARQFFNNK